VAAPPAGGAPPDDGVVRVGRETKGRGGRTVTLIWGVGGDPAARAELAQRLKRLCGSGGGVKGDHIEVQGDHRQRLVAYLSEQGYRVKLAGG
jgi:translation initiation factor 1